MIYMYWFGTSLTCSSTVLSQEHRNLIILWVGESPGATDSHLLKVFAQGEYFQESPVLAEQVSDQERVPAVTQRALRHSSRQGVSPDHKRALLRKRHAGHSSLNSEATQNPDSNLTSRGPRRALPPVTTVFFTSIASFLVSSQYHYSVTL